MRLFPPTLAFYLCNPVTFVLLFCLVIAVMMCGCDDDDELAREAVQNLRCVWSHQYRQCFCAYSVNHRGFMAWAPPDVCKEAG